MGKIKLRRRLPAAIICWLLVIGWMVFIFSMSAQPATASKQTSGGTIRAVLRVVIPDFDSYDSARQSEIIEDWQHFARKTAHFCAYMLLGILLTAAVSSHSRGILFTAGAALSGAALYAASDELHQLFVPGRSGQISDVALDCAGAATGILIASLFTLAVRHIKASRVRVQ